MIMLAMDPFKGDVPLALFAMKMGLAEVNYYYTNSNIN